MTSSSQTSDAVVPGTLIPDLLRRHPEARKVLDEYGLKGCGGPLGPHETLGYFARAHEVDAGVLIERLRDVVAATGAGATAGTEETRAPALADVIYRRFFIAGIAVILTLGATWGAALLWRIGLHQTFSGVGANEINAHAQAQVFGWMGLFIMGFAYQAFPRFWHTSLVAPRLAAVNFWILVSGVLTASIALPLVGRVALAPHAATAGAVLELVSVLVFTWQIVITFCRSGKAVDGSIAYIFTALFWFAVSAAFNLIHTTVTSGLAMAGHRDWAIAACQPVLRDMQFHGLGMSIIFGVSLRTLPAFFGLPKIPAKLAIFSLVLVTLGVASEVALFMAYKTSGHDLFGHLQILASAMLFAGTLCLVVPWRLWRRFPEGDRSEKFIRAGFGWLAVSLLMLMLMPVHETLSHQAFSHAYVGAIRHAITVGFISLMIMGYAAKVAPTLKGIDPGKLPSLRGPFLLVNGGCALRVIMQTATDWLPSLFPLIGISGVLEVSGLVWWGCHLLAVLFVKPEENLSIPAQAAGVQPLSEKSIVAYVVDWHPETEHVFIEFGFQNICNPVMRNTVGRRITLKDACRIKDVDLAEFLAALNHAIQESRCRQADASPHGCGAHNCSC